MKYANTKADYVEGDDFTMIGSRSGANAIAIWMILMTYGPYGMNEKIFILSKRADWFTHKLDEIGIEYFRSSQSNIITMKWKIKLTFSKNVLYPGIKRNHCKQQFLMMNIRNLSKP